MGYSSVDTRLPLMVRTLLFIQSATKRVSKNASYVIPCGLFIRACNFSNLFLDHRRRSVSVGRHGST